MGQLEDIVHLRATVDAGSFAAAARKLGVTPSAVSRRVARLEDELGVRLLARTTRALRLTDDGRAFTDRCARILDELDEAKRSLARSRERPTGTLRVDCGVVVARSLLTPHLPAFLARHPSLSLELTVRDQRVDLVTEGVDVAVRIGVLEPMSLIAKKLGEAEIVVVGSPAYLKRRGRPGHPRDLAKHDVLGFLRDGHPAAWSYLDEGGTRAIAVTGPFHSNDVDALRAVAIAGRGLVYAFDFLVEDDLRAGRLVRVLEDAAPVRWPLHALYSPNRHLLPKVRVFLDFLERVVAKRPARDAEDVKRAGTIARRRLATRAQPRGDVRVPLGAKL
jgi:DNA-binding transcriptional LysR family regulator